MVNPSGGETVSEAFDKIMAGLDDARAYLSGKRDGFALHETDASCPDAVATRQPSAGPTRPPRTAPRSSGRHTDPECPVGAPRPAAGPRG